MKRVAIAGTIGSGKSAVTDYLAARGFGVIDADVIAREVVEPGQPTLQALIDAFGAAILTPEGTLDREFVASVVFTDRSALARLNRITHGAIGVRMGEELSRASGAAVFVALPLYRDEHRALLALDEVWCVVTSRAVALERLVNQRGVSRADAEARLDAQLTSGDCASLADVLVRNEGSLEELHKSVEDLLVQRGWIDA